MLKTCLAAGLLFAALSGAASASCTTEEATAKYTATSQALAGKLSSNADAATKLLTELGQIMGVSPYTEETCTKIDDVAARGKKL